MPGLDLSRAKRLVFALVGVAALSCSAGSDAKPVATEPTMAALKPLIFLSADSFVVTTPGSGRPLLYRIGINADDTTRVRSLATMAGGFDNGDSGTWLSAQLDRASAPATLLMRLDPSAATPGRHPAAITISAPGADPRILHLVLVVLGPGELANTGS
jgi:hypothetical protein